MAILTGPYQTSPELATMCRRNAFDFMLSLDLEGRADSSIIRQPASLVKGYFASLGPSPKGDGGAGLGSAAFGVKQSPPSENMS